MLLDDERDKNQSALSLQRGPVWKKIMFAAVPHARLHAQKNAKSRWAL